MVSNSKMSELPCFDGSKPEKFSEWRKLVVSLAAAEGLSSANLNKEAAGDPTDAPTAWTDEEKKLLARLAGVAKSSLRASALDYSEGKDTLALVIRCLDEVYLNQSASQRCMSLRDLLTSPFPPGGDIGEF